MRRTWLAVGNRIQEGRTTTCARESFERSSALHGVSAIDTVATTLIYWSSYLTTAPGLLLAPPATALGQSAWMLLAISCIKLVLYICDNKALIVRAERCVIGSSAS